MRGTMAEDSPEPYVNPRSCFFSPRPTIFGHCSAYEAALPFLSARLGFTPLTSGPPRQRNCFLIPPSFWNVRPLIPPFDHPDNSIPVRLPDLVT